MNSLSDLKDHFLNRGVSIAAFQGWWLETEKIGRYTLAGDDMFCDGVLIDKKGLDLLVRRVLTLSEFKEMFSGKSQTRKSKEPARWVPDVQTAQGERSETGSPRKGRAGKAQRHSEGDERELYTT